MNIQQLLWRPCLAAVALLMSSPLLAASFDAVYVLGDSLSDVGNRLATDGKVTQPFFTQAIPDSPYAYGGGRYSNGPVWVEYLADAQGLSLSPSELGHGNGYAFGGARSGALPGVADNGVPSVVAQAGQLLAERGTLSPQALVVVWTGGNDVRDAGVIAAGGNLAGASAVLSASINNIGLTIGMLAAHGASHFLVPNLPDLALTPAALAAGPAFQAGARQLSLGFNAGLAQLLPFLSGTLGVQITPLDTFALANRIVAQPSAFGFSNVSAPCAFANQGLGCTAPDQYLFWDAIHPTTHFHQLLAQSAVPLPPALGLLSASLGGLLLVCRRVGQRRVARGMASVLALTLLAGVLTSTPAAADSLQSSGRALGHSVNAVGYALGGSAQLVSGAAAVPLGFAGAVGQLSGDASDELMKAANAELGAPLPITDALITVGPPPSDAIQQHGGDRP